MRKEKHETLGTLRGDVQVAAVKAGVSVDELVHAAKGHPSTSAARMGAANLAPELAEKLKALDWPYDCPRCGASTPALVICTKCGAQGCEACEVAGECTSCRAQARGDAQKARQRADAEAQRAKAVASTAKAEADAKARERAASEEQ